MELELSSQVNERARENVRFLLPDHKTAVVYFSVKPTVLPNLLQGDAQPWQYHCFQEELVEHPENALHHAFAKVYRCRSRRNESCQSAGDALNS